MSVLLIVEPKGTLAASHAVLWWVTLTMRGVLYYGYRKRRDGRTPDRYMTLKALTHDPSRRAVLTARLDGRLDCRHDGRQDGPCVRGAVRIENFSKKNIALQCFSDWRAVKTGRVSGALPLDEASVKKLHRFLRAGCFCHTTGSVKVLTEAHSTDLTQRPEMAVCCSGNALVSINKVNLRWAWLVLGWVTVSGFDSRRRHFISDCNQPPRSTQPSTLRGTVKWVPAKGQWCSVARE